MNDQMSVTGSLKKKNAKSDSLDFVAVNLNFFFFSKIQASDTSVISALITNPNFSQSREKKGD